MPNRLDAIPITSLIAVQHSGNPGELRIILEQAAELTQPAFTAQLLGDLPQHPGIQPGAGRGGFHRVPRFGMRLAQRCNRLFRQFRRDADLSRDCGNIHVSGHLAQNSIQQTHDCDSICKPTAMMPAKP